MGLLVSGGNFFVGVFASKDLAKRSEGRVGALAAVSALELLAEVILEGGNGEGTEVVGMLGAQGGDGGVLGILSAEVQIQAAALAVRGLEGDGLVLAAVPEHEVGVSPGGLGGLHFKSVVVMALKG